ncbi:hypothetical protein [Streptomyces xanthii]|uniref:Secreted protein n=1 Tax=Streptomyces xanthii TaxID=2768069 RepID=A0A7H1B6P3_9ACTN|nr:hypothetical protein [Streptomyces xanthii]QNS04398.1 hypothetical protein IAG42_12705 [Streptomyces xanthii]
MNLRRTTTTRRALAAVALTTGLALGTLGCGGGDDDKPNAEKPAASAPKSTQGGDSAQSPSATPDKVLAESKDGDITVTVNAAKRDGGGYVTVSGTVRNDGANAWLGENWRSDEQELRKNGGSLAGASLVDEAGKKKYLILRDTQGRCLCTKFNGQIRSGESASWYAQFPAPPEGTNSVTFQVGAMPPAAIEISEGE